ncbi:unnamed protein product [Paramecium pentaurelia]|uniref:Uncharacterized protein n=1 Tax=Paramecium pentaurelia TaxID=43138 RepID=A0A8S1YIU3_9CILI|nr:unnamed protein product [Paramecium pentaurelia]
MNNEKKNEYSRRALKIRNNINSVINRMRNHSIINQSQNILYHKMIIVSQQLSIMIFHHYQQDVIQKFNYLNSIWKDKTNLTFK